MLALVMLLLYPLGWRIYFVSYWDGWLFWGSPSFQGNKEDEGWCWFWYGLWGWRFFCWSFLDGYMVKSLPFCICSVECLLGLLCLLGNWFQLENVGWLQPLCFYCRNRFNVLRPLSLLTILMMQLMVVSRLLKLLTLLMTLSYPNFWPKMSLTRAV